MTSLAPFRKVYLADFEYHAPDGERPTPICMVARELRSGETLRLWAEELTHSPFTWAADVLFVAYYASAELGCFLALDWPMPTRILDLFVEFRNMTNGRSTPCGSGLLGALAYHGFASIDAAEKESMRNLAIRGGPFTDTEKTALLEYCETDVDALAKLLPAMLPKIDLPRALFRGRYMPAAAKMEWNGTPIDVETLVTLQHNWEAIKTQLVQAVDADFGVYVPTGQRELDPANKRDAAILDAAAEWGLDPYELSRAVSHVWRTERESTGEHSAAVAAARKRTGLTAAKINRIENAGKDFSTVPGLDVTARTLASELPALGIGDGYHDDAGYDDADYSGDLWELLRESTRGPLRKDSPEVLRQALNLLTDAPEAVPSGPLSFSSKRFAGWLATNGIPWPHLESGDLDLSDKCFRQMVKIYPAVAPLRELRYSMSQLRLNDLSVGTDGRNRTILSAYRAKTGRNAPKSAQFIFGPSCWMRGLIQPAEGRALAYIDWSAQEIAIAAKLSGDVAMQDAYTSGDPYLWLGKAGGVIPANATKKTHGELRDVFKVVYLGFIRDLRIEVGSKCVNIRPQLRLGQTGSPLIPLTIGAAQQG